MTFSGKNRIFYRKKPTIDEIRELNEFTLCHLQKVSRDHSNCNFPYKKILIEEARCKFQSEFCKETIGLVFVGNTSPRSTYLGSWIRKLTKGLSKVRMVNI